MHVAGIALDADVVRPASSRRPTHIRPRRKDGKQKPKKQWSLSDLQLTDPVVVSKVALASAWPVR